MTEARDNTTVLEGVLKDIFGALSQSLDYDFIVKHEPDSIFGSLQTNGSYSGILGSLHRKENDIGGPLVVTEQRSVVADFAGCLEHSSRGIISAVESVDRNVFLYAKVFSWKVWLSLCLSVIFVALIITIFEIFYEESSRVNFNFMVKNIWILFIYTLEKDSGFSSKLDRRIWSRLPFRILLTAWLLGPVINLLLIFQSSITSTFAVSQLRPVIADLEDLAKKTETVPVTTKGSSTEICFKTSERYSSIWARMKYNTIKFTPETVEDILKKVEKGTHILIVDYMYALGLASKWTKRTGFCKICVEEAHICQSFISLGLRKGLPPKLVRKINSRLTYIIQGKLTDRWLHRVFSNYTDCSKQQADEIKPLTLMDIFGGFLIWISGIGVSFVTFIIELIKAQKRSTNAIKT